MKSLLLSLVVLVSFTTNAQTDLEEAGKKKAQQQDFNTTRNNKERNSYKSSSAPKSAPPAPAAPAQGAGPDSNEIHLDWYQFEFDQVFVYRLINTAPAPRNDLKVKMIYGRNACWIEEPGNTTFTIQDFLRGKLFYVDTSAKTVKVVPLRWVNSTLNTASFTTDGVTKTIQGVACRQYSNQASNKNTYATFWLADELELDVIYQQYRPYVLEMQFFHQFVNGKKPVLEQMNYSLDQPTSSMTVIHMEKISLKLDLTHYTLIP